MWLFKALHLVLVISAIFGLAKMAVTGKQYGGRKLHMAYRIMIVPIFVAVLGSYLVVRYSN